MVIRARLRRALLVTAIAVIMIGVGAALGWFVVLPKMRPVLRAGEMYGIDVSNHQGLIDWHRVAEDRIGFAYLKATEGRGYVDREFAANWQAARSADIRRGAYHFFTECASGRDQAANFLRVAAPDPSALAPAVDLEVLTPCSDPAPDVDAELRTFVATVEAAWGRPLVVYARESWTSRHPRSSLSDRPQWQTSFVGRPAEPWQIWQVHYFAEVDGISGRVDLDVGRA